MRVWCSYLVCAVPCRVQIVQTSANCRHSTFDEVCLPDGWLVSPVLGLTLACYIVYSGTATVLLPAAMMVIRVKQADWMGYLQRYPQRHRPGCQAHGDHSCREPLHWLDFSLQDHVAALSSSADSQGPLLYTPCQRHLNHLQLQSMQPSVLV